MKTLTFSKQHSIADFKALNNGNAIDIIKNPQTGKLFFTCGSVTGAVATKGYASPVVSLVTDGAESFYMLHSKNETNLVDSL